MTIRTLLATCGLAAALATPSIAAAQPADRDNTRQYGTQTGQDARRNASDGKALLEKLEGVWKVEATVDAGQWKESKQGGTDANRPNQRRDADAERNTRRTPDQRRDRQDSMNADEDNQQLTGMAETRLVLGGSVLRGNAYMTKGEGDTRKTAGRNDSEQAMHGISYISFNAETGSYTAVFMSSRDSEIMYNTGTYDTANRRIVFNANGSSSTSQSDAWSDRDPMNRDRTNRDRDTRDRADRDQPGREGEARNPWANPDERDDNRRTGTTTPGQDGDVTVVLEVLDDDTHRVTMYKGTPNLAANNARPGNMRDRDTTRPGSAPGQDTTRPGTAPGQDTTRPGTMPGRDNAERDDRSSTLENNMIYRATYTRASDSEAGELRRKLKSMNDENQITRQ